MSSSAATSLEKTYRHLGVVVEHADTVQPALDALSASFSLTLLAPVKDQHYHHCPLTKDDLDAIIVFGGDGFMLHTLHSYMACDIPLYGLNIGSVGFLMNAYDPEAVEALASRLQAARITPIHPLTMQTTHEDGSVQEALAINEVSLLRHTGQAAHLSIAIDGIEHLPQLVADGILVSTPAGSSAYNFSVGGPILPIKSNLLALTPISPFRPRRWKGALLPQHSTIRFTVLDPEKRPVNAVADFVEMTHVQRVEISDAKHCTIPLLFDPGHSLEERILREQFAL